MNGGLHVLLGIADDWSPGARGYRKIIPARQCRGIEHHIGDLLDGPGSTGYSCDALELDEIRSEREEDGENVVARRIHVENDPVLAHCHAFSRLRSWRDSAVSRKILGRCR